MPRSPARPCTWPQGCPELVEGGSRCPAHRHVTQRPKTAARGYDQRWRDARAQHLAASPYCTAPGCTAPAIDVDHIDNLGPHGPLANTTSNLRSYCHSCHAKKTARETPGGWNKRP